MKKYINAKELMKPRSYTKAEFTPHDLSEKAWTVYSQTDDKSFGWMKKIIFDDDGKEYYKYYKWYYNSYVAVVGTIEDVNSYLESEYDEYWA